MSARNGSGRRGVQRHSARRKRIRIGGENRQILSRQIGLVGIWLKRNDLFPVGARAFRVVQTLTDDATFKQGGCVIRLKRQRLLNIGLRLRYRVRLNFRHRFQPVCLRRKERIISERRQIPDDGLWLIQLEERPVFQQAEGNGFRRQGQSVSCGVGGFAGHGRSEPGASGVGGDIGPLLRGIIVSARFVSGRFMRQLIELLRPGESVSGHDFRNRPAVSDSPFVAGDHVAGHVIVHIRGIIIQKGETFGQDKRRLRNRCRRTGGAGPGRQGGEQHEGRCCRAACELDRFPLSRCLV